MTTTQTCHFHETLRLCSEMHHLSCMTYHFYANHNGIAAQTDTRHVHEKSLFGALPNGRASGTRNYSNQENLAWQSKHSPSTVLIDTKPNKFRSWDIMRSVLTTHTWRGTVDLKLQNQPTCKTIKVTWHGTQPSPTCTRVIEHHWSMQFTWPSLYQDGSSFYDRRNVWDSGEVSGSWWRCVTSMQDLTHSQQGNLNKNLMQSHIETFKTAAWISHRMCIHTSSESAWICPLALQAAAPWAAVLALAPVQVEALQHPHQARP